MDVSVIIPVYNEGERITACLDSVFAVPGVGEVLVVYDSAEDTTAPPLARYAAREPRLCPLLNTYGRGPANAIRFGFDAATKPVSVVSMADGSDEVSQIAELAGLVESGAVIAAGSRYMRGGRQLGGPLIKGLMSRIAGVSLYHLARVGTRDATNSFKAYRTDFVRAAGIESEAGFEVGIELVAKARRARLRVVEIPTTWRDRTEGQSRFRLLRWIPKYLRWYFHAFGRRLPIEGFTP